MLPMKIGLRWCSCRFDGILIFKFLLNFFLQSLPMFTSIWRNFINFLLNFFLIRFHEKVFFLIILVFKSLNRFINGWIMTCLAKNEIYSLKWEKCARCAKMRRLVGARVIFFMRQVTAFCFWLSQPIRPKQKSSIHNKSVLYNK